MVWRQSRTPPYEMWVAMRWDGKDWEDLGFFTVFGGFRRYRVASPGSKLWIALERKDNMIQLGEFDGSAWTFSFPVVGSSGTISSTDLAVYQGAPHLAYIEDETLKVTRVPEPTLAVLQLAALSWMAFLSTRNRQRASTPD